jgi:hypothetical protein
MYYNKEVHSVEYRTTQELEAILGLYRKLKNRTVTKNTNMNNIKNNWNLENLWSTQDV